jgi:hypothetical protein
MAAPDDNNDEINPETVEPLRPLARQRIEDGELPRAPIPEEVLTYPPPHGGVRSPDDRPRDYCRLCGKPISQDVVQWYRLPGPLKKTEPFVGTKPELHAACFTAWRLEVLNAQQEPCPAGFTAYTVGTSLEKGPLRFCGRILAQAERDQDSDTLRYVLYETSAGDFVGEATLVGRFTERERFETQERAFSWFGDQALRAELLRQLKPT